MKHREKVICGKKWKRERKRERARERERGVKHNTHTNVKDKQRKNRIDKFLVR